MNLPAGIYPDISAELYHADNLCEQPSLSSSMIKRLLTGSPAEAAALHPRLTKWREWADKRNTPSQDKGTLAHSLILQSGGCDYHAIDPRDLADPPYNIKTKKGQPYTTWSGDAKAWREAQEASGAIVLGKSEHAGIQSAVDSMRQLIISEYGDFPIGESEVTLIWQAHELPSIIDSHVKPIWCRARLDHWSPRFMVILDVKFTDLSIDDEALLKKAEYERWDIQAAWYLNGLNALIMPGHDGKNATFGDITFRFPVAQLYPPYQSRFFDLTETRLQFGQTDCARAAAIFAKCLHANDWPPHERTFKPEVSEWMIRQYEERELML